MFHHTSSSSSIFGQRAEHHVGMSKLGRQHKKSGGLGLRPHNSNIDHSPPFNGVVTKTPLNNKSSSKRRALGDISNRKGTSSHGNGNGGVSKSMTKGKKMEFSIYTPHKQGDGGLGKGKGKGVGLSTKSSIHNNANTLKKNASVKNTKKQYPLSTKKKAVSFSLQASHRNSLKESFAPPPPLHTAVSAAAKASAFRPSKNHLQNELKPVQKSKASRSTLRQRQKSEVEDIEVSAGRTGDEERELLGEEEFKVPMEVQEVMDTIRDIQRMDQEERDLNHAREYEEYLRNTDNFGDLTVMMKQLKVYEEEEEAAVEDVPCFDHVDSLLYDHDLEEDDLSLALAYDVDDLLSHDDDISV